MTTAIQAREAVHLLILQNLARSPGPDAFVVKGGVNLRLFFGSPRYSEDMDLDGEPSSRRALRDALREVFTDRDLRDRLREIGLRGLDPGEGPNKDTATTFRYKFGVLGTGGIRYPTKVEVSFRDRADSGEVLVERVDRAIVDLYAPTVEPGLEVPHYSRPAALRQKLKALAGRRLVQARDIFDLYLLRDAASTGEMDRSLSYLREAVPVDVLSRAHERVFAVTHDEYRGQVLEFLPPHAREELGGRDTWDEIRLAVNSFIERIQALQAGGRP